MNETKIKEKVRELIKRNDEVYKGVKSAWSFLYKYLDDINEIETLGRLKEVEGGKFLFAYLAYKSIVRANYQTEHLGLTNFESTEELLGALEADILNYEKGLDRPPREPDANELLEMLRKQIEQGKIKRGSVGSEDAFEYVLETKDYLLNLDEIELEDPKVEAEKVLAKHGLSKETPQDLVKCPQCDNTRFLWNDKEKRYYCEQHPQEKHPWNKN